MRNIICILLVLLIVGSNLNSQLFLNGGFENNQATVDMINLDDSEFDAAMADCKSIGWNSNLDIITSTDYCDSTAVEGNWYVALTGAGSDVVSMKLDSNLVAGTVYQISFYDRYCEIFEIWTPELITLGLSEMDTTYGDPIYTTQQLATENWSERIATFTAPNNGQYVTVRLEGGSTGSTWVQVDGFKFESSSSFVEVSTELTQVYPNPTSTKLYFRNLENVREIRIYDGNMKLKSNHKNYADGIDISSFESGVYIVHLVNEDNQFQIERIVKN